MGEVDRHTGVSYGGEAVTEYKLGVDAAIHKIKDPARDQ
jgi:hypothetical protein